MPMLVVVGASLVLSSCGDSFRPPAAVVEGRPITQETLQAQLAEVLADPTYARQVKGPEGESRRKELTRQLLAFLIRQSIIERFAAGSRISVSAEEVDRQLDQFIEQAGGQEAFDRLLEERHLTLPQARQSVRRIVLTSKVQDAVAEQTLGDSPELRQEYEQRVAEFTTVGLAHIVVPTKAAAAKVTTRLSASRPVTPRAFARVARELSTEASTARRGGDLGSQPLAGLPRVIARVASRLDPGEVSDAVRTDAGWEIILLKEREVVPFEQARPQLLEPRREGAFNDWLRQQLARADIEVNPQFGRFDAETGEIQPITSTASTP